MLTPIVEARGAVPYGLAVGLHPVMVIVIAVISATAIVVGVRLALEVLYSRFLVNWAWFSRRLEGAQQRGRPYTDKYGVLGLIMFTAIPLPITGVYTGTLLSWTLGMRLRASLIAVVAGGVVSSLVLTLVALGVLKGLSLL